ncbi:MAG: response regulator [Anaerolineae bacterium]|nr:response regulator [Anaerolineae bacterium]
MNQPLPSQPQSSSSATDAGQLIFSHLTVESGLSHAVATHLAQDAQGTIWLGTEGGLNRFDGQTVKAYRHDPQHSNSLSHNVIKAMVIDRAGWLWIGTANGLNKFDPHTETFTRYHHQPGKPDSLGFDAISALHLDQTGHLWLGGPGELDQFDPRTEAVVRYGHRPGDRTTVGPGVVTCMVEDEAGRLWVGQRDGGGLSRFDRQRRQFERVHHQPHDSHSRGDEAIGALCLDWAGGLWIGTEDGGLCYFDRAAESVTRYWPQANRPDRLSQAGVTDIIEDRAGQLWVATTDGLYCLDRTGQSLAHYRHDPANPTGLSSSSLLRLFEDRSEGLWVTTDNGVNYCAPRYQQFLHFSNRTLLARMRHELRTPLNAIIGFSQLAMHNQDNPDDTQDYLLDIIRSGEQLLTLINEGLGASKVERSPSMDGELGAMVNHPHAAPHQQAVTLAPDQPRYRLLIVDDDSSSRQLLRNLLAGVGPPERGFELREAENGQQAVEQWAAFAPHLIWMDLRMPVMDGYEATKIIKAKQNAGHTIAPKVIVLATSRYEEKRAEVLDIGYDASLRKPFGQAEIFSLLEQHLGAQFVAATAVDAVNPAADIAAVPGPLRDSLEKAAQLGDMDAVEATIEEIQSVQPALAAQLTQLAEAFDYLQIVAILQGRNHE